MGITHHFLFWSVWICLCETLRVFFFFRRWGSDAAKELGLL